LRLIEPTAGSVCFRGQELSRLDGRRLRRLRRHFQMVFQDPFGSLNPRQRVGAMLAEPMAVHRLCAPAERATRVRDLLQTVGLPAEAAERFPHEFSGGQRQRIAIARALATEPELLIADEPVSALDVFVRGQILNLLARLRADLGLAMLFIGHDLALIERIADRVAVMYLGRIVELAPRQRLFSAPAHPYTVALLSAVPVPDPQRRAGHQRLAGEPGNAAAPPSGCPFHPRCPIARPRCAVDVPVLHTPDRYRSEHQVACHYPGEAGAR
jgi:oligopeptide/dipeptide ABC transporter ATP-binding protein